MSRNGLTGPSAQKVAVLVERPGQGVSEAQNYQIVPI